MSAKFLASTIYEGIRSVSFIIYGYGLKLLHTLILYKKIFLLAILVISLYFIFKFLWRHRENLSKFLWLPEPIIGGALLSIFGQFYKNNLIAGLLELQNFLNSLPSTTPIILILGEEDNFTDIVTSYKNTSITWFFIRNNIYLYIKEPQNIKLTISFLNRIKSEQPINSLVIKTSLEDSLYEDVIKTVAMTSGLKVPLYLVFSHIKWCDYMWEYFPINSIIGFLLDNSDVVSSLTLQNNLNNLKLYIWEKMLKTYNCKLDFWNDFDETKDILLEKILYVYELNYNFFRGVFFTSNEFKVHLNKMLELPQERNNYFIDFYKEVVEQEVLLATPMNQDSVFISRYTTYKNNMLIVGILLVTGYFVNMNLNMWSFDKKYTAYLFQSKNMLNEHNLKQSSKNQAYVIYNLIKNLNDVNLSSIYYVYYPHNYLVNNLYELLCETEELVIFKILNDKDLISSSNQLGAMENSIDYSFNRFYEYTSKILEVEKNIFNNSTVKRFGIYKKRSETNTKNAKIFFESAFEDIRNNYYNLLKSFLSEYCNESFAHEIIDMREKINDFFKSSNITISEMENLIEAYYHLKSSLKLKNNKIQMAKMMLLIEHLNASNIFGPNVALETTNLIKEELNKFYMQISEIKNNIVGNIICVENHEPRICDKFTTIISDMEKFLQEPFMENINNEGPKIPPNKMISSWNIVVLKDILNMSNKAPEFKEKLNTYSPELHAVFFDTFQRKLAKSIYNKIAIAQNIVSFEYINMQNFVDAFNITSLLLDLFFVSGNIDYYNSIIKIFLHDMEMLGRQIDDKLHETIFYSYSRMHLLKKNNVQELICNTNNSKKIKSLLESEVNLLLSLYYNYMAPLLKIMESDHFIKYRGTQYMKYRSLSEEIRKYDKGLENSIQRFCRFIENLNSYSIYNSFSESFDNKEEEGYLEDLLQNLKDEITQVSQKLYREELILSYDNMRQAFKTFTPYFPFNTSYGACVPIEDIYNFLHKYKKSIDLFHNNVLGDKILLPMQQLKVLGERILQDKKGYYMSCKVFYKESNKNNQHMKYVGVVNINQTKTYARYLIQDEIKIYMKEPIYLHVEISPHADLRILRGSNNAFKVERKHNGVTLIFDDFWSFLNYIYSHEQYRTQNDITIIVSIPVVYGKNHSHIRFPITFKDFLFFPSTLPSLEDKS